MLQLGMPHVNVLSKVDLIEKYGTLAYNLQVRGCAGALAPLPHALPACSDAL
jgi:hypothetical protein